MANVGAWVVENCSSYGYDDLTLTGSVNGFTEFSRAIPMGDVWYSIKDSNGNREEGIGAFDGSITIIRKTIHATLEGNVYNDVDPTPISLSGSSIVSCTLNAAALRTILDDITTVITVAPDQPPYRRYDGTSEASTYYKGWSNSSNTTTATWKILKGVEVSPNNYQETWADGNELLDNIWDNRLTYSYS